VAGIGKAALAALVASTCLILPSVASASPDPEASFDRTIEPRIVNGKGTSVDRWPWQVALLDRRFGSSETSRYFCSGSLIAPDLVITAAHCVADYRPGELGNIDVIAGRTYLKRKSSGERLSVASMHLALDAGSTGSAAAQPSGMSPC